MVDEFLVPYIVHKDVTQLQRAILDGPWNLNTLFQQRLSVAGL
jgi:hypothetical protein